MPANLFACSGFPTLLGPDPIRPLQNAQTRKASRWALGVVMATLAIGGCGDDPGTGDGTVTLPTETATPLAVQVSEIETRIAEYCEKRSSGSVSGADDDQAAADVRTMIRLARRDPGAEVGSNATARGALANVGTLLDPDCNPPLQRRVNRALDALP